MIDPYGERLCQYCGQPVYDTEAKSKCPGPSIEQMHRNLAENLLKFRFVTDINYKDHE